MECRNFMVLVVVISAAIIGIVSSYPNNVPNSPDVCSKMTPGHGPRPQRSKAPYEIILNKQKVQGGNNLQIVLQGIGGLKFKGFFMQVRDEHGSPVGSFLIPDEKEIGTQNCFNGKHNEIHHKNPNDKESITVYWKAPEQFDDKVRVVATVVQDFLTYWVNVKAPELVTITNTTDYFLSSSDFIEKRKETPSKNSKATGILNYNPYSPFSPLLSLDTNDSSLSSTEFLLSQASEDTAAIAQERQLFDFPSFDFHKTPYSPKLSSPRKPKTVFTPRPEHAQPPYTEPLENLPLFSPIPSNNGIIPHRNSGVSAPKGSVFFNKQGDIKEKHSEFFNAPKMPLPFSYPPGDNSYNFEFPPPSVHETQPAPFFPPNSYDKPITFTSPQLSQSIQGEKGGHYPYFINHHYLQNPTYKPTHHKPSSDPSYPNSGYFPKDILTRLTSYIPNIYNAIANNPLFNFNIDNTIESIWKPMKGVPTKHGDFPVSSATTTTKMQMPKYGYLVYNPVRKNPYFVIPAENEEEFVANHMGRRKDSFAPHHNFN